MPFYLASQVKSTQIASETRYMFNWKRYKQGIREAVKERFISHHLRLYLTFVSILVCASLECLSLRYFSFSPVCRAAVERTRHIDLSYLRWKLCIIWLCMIAGHKTYYRRTARDSSVKLNFRKFFILLVCDFHSTYDRGGSFWMLNSDNQHACYGNCSETEIISFKYDDCGHVRLLGWVANFWERQMLFIVTKLSYLWIIN